MDHVGVVVEDLPAAIGFFLALGLELEGQGTVEGDWVDRVIGLQGSRSELAMMQTPDGHSRLELVRFESPPAGGNRTGEPANALGIRHLTFAVEDLDAVLERLRPHRVQLVGQVEKYRDVYRLCYVRGPAGMIIELAEELG